LRAAPEGFFGAGSEGFAGSRCSMFFKLLRIDLGRFSAMRAVEGIELRHSITTVSKQR
jgi:hypothetical protein